MSKIHLVCGREDGYEPAEWFVKAFRQKRKAEALIKRYKKAADDMRAALEEFDRENPEPEITNESDAWDQWVHDRQTIRERHPDEHSYSVNEWYYYIAKLDLV